jgi:ABC-2 type transport system permease protein
VPILVASIVTGWAVFIPTILIVLAIAMSYGMPMPDRWLSLFTLISFGVMAFRAIGLIVASVANSIQESNIMVQTLYLPMLVLSGATFQMSSLPSWAQIAGQFLPTYYLVTGFQGIFLRNESLLENGFSLLALLATIVIATFIATKLFRWEKEEKIPSAAKLWVVAVLVPFFVLGIYQVLFVPLSS